MNISGVNVVLTWDQNIFTNMSVSACGDVPDTLKINNVVTVPLNSGRAKLLYQQSCDVKNFRLSTGWKIVGEHLETSISLWWRGILICLQSILHFTPCTSISTIQLYDQIQRGYLFLDHWLSGDFWSIVEGKNATVVIFPGDFCPCGDEPIYSVLIGQTSIVSPSPVSSQRNAKLTYFMTGEPWRSKSVSTANHLQLYLQLFTKLHHIFPEAIHCACDHLHINNIFYSIDFVHVINLHTEWSHHDTGHRNDNYGGYETRAERLEEGLHHHFIFVARHPLHRHNHFHTVREAHEKERIRRVSIEIHFQGSLMTTGWADRPLWSQNDQSSS